MSNLNDLVNQDLSGGFPLDNPRSAEFFRNAEEALKGNNLEAAMLNYEAALRLDPSNSQVIQRRELVSHYYEALNNLATHWLSGGGQRSKDYPAAVEHLKKVVAVDPNFKSAMNMLRTAASMCDNCWDIWADAGVLATKEDKPNPDKVIAGLEPIYKWVCEKYGGDMLSYNDRRALPFLDWKSIYAMIADRERSFLGSKGVSPVVRLRYPIIKGREFDRVDHLINNLAWWEIDHSIRLAAVDKWKHKLDVWFVETRKYDEGGREEMLKNFDDEKYEWVGYLDRLRLGKCSLRRTTVKPTVLLRKPEWNIYSAEDTFPILVDIWEIPFGVELSYGLKRVSYLVPRSLFEEIFDNVYTVGYFGGFSVSVDLGVVRVLSSGEIIGYKLNEDIIRPQQIDFEPFYKIGLVDESKIPAPARFLSKHPSRNYAAREGLVP